uniref:Golgi-specific brefeldin A-resistance guanine nucleotide exchange factor 1 isoform X3 n=1 Tax=Myxine glutinosa TaxID=7769 RepID=UPI00358F0A71
MAAAIDKRIYIVQGEITTLANAIKRTSRWSSHTALDDEQDPLLASFSHLRDILSSITNLKEIEANCFLRPFLEVIRSEDTTGPITGLALSTINKFLSYGLIDTSADGAAAATENMADAVTHARFVGTDPASDEVVLMKILQVLRMLLLTEIGSHLNNESVCEIMQSCFRICFETRLSELLRKSAEHALVDMVQFLFTRLPVFKEEGKNFLLVNMKKLKMRPGGIGDQKWKKHKRSQKALRYVASPGGFSKVESVSESSQAAVTLSPEGIHVNVALNGQPAPNMKTTANGEHSDTVSTAVCPDSSQEERLPIVPVPEIPLESVDNVDNRLPFPDQADANLTMVQEMHPCKSVALQQTEELHSDTPRHLTLPDYDSPNHSVSQESMLGVMDDRDSNEESLAVPENQDAEYVNPRGVRFTNYTKSAYNKEGNVMPIPYGLPCIRELFRFLVSLSNPLDRHSSDRHNSEHMIHMGLQLLTVAMETAHNHVARFPSLLMLVKDDLCRHLFQLLGMEHLPLYAASLKLCFFLFESIREHLKLQLEMFLKKLTDVITSESPRIPYEMKEMALEALVQLWHVPGLVTELYINYDCDFYCSNLFEDLTKLLSKNAFPVTGQLFTTHLLSLEALLTVVHSIESHCQSHGMRDTVAVANVESQENAEAGKCFSAEKKLSKTPCRFSSLLPIASELSTIKTKKKLLIAGTEQFNQKPHKGIQFLQEQGLLASPMNCQEVARWLRENPRLEKKMIGEFISDRKHLELLSAFVRTFNTESLRIDESLRLYLEAFRLPGEAPLIHRLFEAFTDYWHSVNGHPFANNDACFALAYAIIMLNTDQHNQNVRKQNIPMTVEEFKKNLKGVNGQKDFDQDMLEEIYNAIRTDEIVMPEEQMGLVRENYVWNVLLHRGASEEGVFLHVPASTYDLDLFSMSWGPTVAALSYVFDKSTDDAIIQKIIMGFRKCAIISAHYNLNDVFDNLIISLCKFTMLNNEAVENLPVAFGSNPKAQLAGKMVFGLAHEHGDILREGWKNIMDSLLQLFRAKLLPNTMVEVEDFVDPNGRVSILREESFSQRSDSAMFSFVNWLTLSGPEQSTQRVPSAEDQDAKQAALDCVMDCQPEQLIAESRFLRVESLQELIKALISVTPEYEGYDEEAAVFYLETLLQIILQNRDRVSCIWNSVRDHLYQLILHANEHSFLLERTVVGFLRLAIRLLRKEEISEQMLRSLRVLLLMKPLVLAKASRQIAYGVHELLKTNAANIHSHEDWATLFMLLECVGAGARPPPLHSFVNMDVPDTDVQSDSEVIPDSSPAVSDRGYTSDTEIYNEHVRSTRIHRSTTEINIASAATLQFQHDEMKTGRTTTPVNQYSLSLGQELGPHDTKSLIKCVESLSFIVRDAAHITPENFSLCVHAIRVFVEASINGGNVSDKKTKPHKYDSGKSSRFRKKGKDRESNGRKNRGTGGRAGARGGHSEEEEEEEDSVPASYHTVSLQLLDLLHTLHTRAAGIYTSWAQEQGKQESPDEVVKADASTLWANCWCPLLQGMARLCCDARRQVRMQALTYLQRALLVHDLQTLSALEWEACFNKVLFPLLTKLLENISPADPAGMEETRMRVSTLLCKVFLQHLSPLLSLSTFTALWLTILDFMDKYIHANSSDLLLEAIPESLKNMLLVMDTAGIFQNAETRTGYSQLWEVTWERIDCFLPGLREDLFRQPVIPDSQVQTPSRTASPVDVVTSQSATSQAASDESKAGSPGIATEHASSSVSTSNEQEPQLSCTTGQAAQSTVPTVRPPSPAVEIPPALSQSPFILQPPLPALGPPQKERIPSIPLPIILNPALIEATSPVPLLTGPRSEDSIPSNPPSTEAN